MKQDIAEIAKSLTRGQKDIVKARHTENGNPWPFISMTQRAGGAKDRTFRRITSAGLYGSDNCLTDLGLAVRAHLLAHSHPEKQA